MKENIHSPGEGCHSHFANVLYLNFRSNQFSVVTGQARVFPKKGMVPEKVNFPRNFTLFEITLSNSRLGIGL